MILVLLGVVLFAGAAEAAEVVLDGRAQCATLHRGTFGTPADLVHVVLRNCTSVKAQGFTIHGSLTIEPTASRIVLQRGLIDGHDRTDICLDFSESHGNKIQTTTFQHCQTLVKALCANDGRCSNILFHGSFKGTPGRGQVGFELQCSKSDWNSNRFEGVDVGYYIHPRPSICEIAFPTFDDVATPFRALLEDGSESDQLQDVCGGLTVGRPTVDGHSYSNYVARPCAQ